MGKIKVNKLIVDEALFLVENKDFVLDVKTDCLHLMCRGNNKLILNSNCCRNLKITLEDECWLEIDFNILGEQMNVEIIQNNKTNFNFKQRISVDKNVSLNIKNVINGNSNKSNIDIKSIAYEGNMEIEVTADVLKMTKDNEIVENIKGINQGGKIIVKPIMEVNTNEVIANHFVAISGVNKEELFYLESKGLSENEAKNLLLKGFLK